MAYLLSRETPTPESDTQAKQKAVQRQAKSDSISIPPRATTRERQDGARENEREENNEIKSKQHKGKTEGAGGLNLLISIG